MLPTEFSLRLAAATFVAWLPACAAGGALAAEGGAPPAAEASAAPDYAEHVAPLLRKYCVSCHNADDREGKLALDSYTGILAGGEHGAILTAGRPDLSRMARVLTGEARPAMPPKGNEGPTAGEIARLKSWIAAGAKGPLGAEPDPTVVIAPRIPAAEGIASPINALAASPDGKYLAVARYAEVELLQLPGRKPERKLTGIRGKVLAVSFSNDGRFVLAAGGEPGIVGEAVLWNVADGRPVQVFRGHRDALYAAAPSPDGRYVATGGYDQRIKLWDAATGSELRTLEGHNGAVFDLAFHPRGGILASASADRTVKLWRVEDGTRLDTLGQSLKGLYTLAFRPDGRELAAAGVDNRIRLWKIGPQAAEGTNPLLVSRFAHEGALLRIVYSRDGKTLVSSAEDRLVKAWNADDVTLRQSLPEQPDWAPALAVSFDGKTLYSGGVDGLLAAHRLEAAAETAAATASPMPDYPESIFYGPQPAVDKLPKAVEIEPNDRPAEATAMAAPGTATGRIHGESGGGGDVDLFRFSAGAGEQWIVETAAARRGSPLDSRIEILDAEGRPVPRVLLRAVRDTEIEFRGMNSDQRGVRLKNWEEMLLNQYVYLGGEVIKHYQQRRGPDADAQFYPHDGKRHAYFDTTARAHALGEPGYVVVPYPLGSELGDNGLPVITLNYENDDDGERKLDADSRLTFTAPADGEYLVRVADVRGFAGPSYTYQLVIRRPQPEFSVSLAGNTATVGAGGGKEFIVKADRIDGFQGPIDVQIAGLPPGYTATTPLVIEAGHLEARGVLNAAADAADAAGEAWAGAKVTATAAVAGVEVRREAGTLGPFKIDPKPKLLVRLLPTPATKGDSATASQSPAAETPLEEVVIRPGQTVTCHLRVERNGFNGEIKFEVDNLPHGIIVDNIGLNGVLILAGKSDRTIYLTAESWVQPARRTFHAVAKVEGDQASNPLVLVVEP